MSVCRKAPKGFRHKVRLDPHAKALEAPLFKPRVVPSKKAYVRVKPYRYKLTQD